jgi:uncharacterized membrane protein
MSQYRSAKAVYSAKIEFKVKKISTADVWQAVRLGWKDFMLQPSHYFFTVVLYPFIGFVLYFGVAGESTIRLLFPMLAGFALIGPFVALLLYEISRRLEQGLDTSWRQVFSAMKSPALPAILTLGLMLAGLFMAWLITANLLYVLVYGPVYPLSLIDFVKEVVTTPRGWLLIVLGNGLGFCFALLAFCTTVVAFPLMLEHQVGALCGIQASLQAVRVNPVPLFLWGGVICLGLFLATLPFLMGLIIVLPVFGHATWHIYRKVLFFPVQQGNPPKNGCVEN